MTCIPNNYSVLCLDKLFRVNRGGGGGRWGILVYCQLLGGIEKCVCVCVCVSFFLYINH